jgi:2'-5' RNA ligase
MSPDVNPGGKGHALWLVPAEPAFSLLAGQIARLSRELATPQFDPHITLLSRIMLPEQEALARSAVLAARLTSFQIELDEMNCLDEYFRCIFADVLTDASILKARQIASEIFSMQDEPPYMPHISLVYGKLCLETKERIVAELASMAGRRFEVRRLALWRVSGPVCEWTCVKEYELD